MSKIENIYDHPDYYSLEDFEGEIWKQIPGEHPQYFVSNLGRIKSTGSEFTGRWGEMRLVRGRIIRISTFIRGYKRVNLERKGMGVHVAVALAFLGPKPTPKHQVNHKNGIKADNRVENLEWMTPAENTQHAVDTGLLKVVKGLHNKKSFQVAQYRKDGSLVTVHGSMSDAGDAMGVHDARISISIKKGWRLRGFTWKRITKEEYFRLKKQLAPKDLEGNNLFPSKKEHNRRG